MYGDLESVATLWRFRSHRDIIIIIISHVVSGAITQFQWEPLSVGVKFATFFQPISRYIVETVQDGPTITIERVSDRSTSVSVTLSDLEGLDARGF